MKHGEECRGIGAAQNLVSTIDIPGFVSFKMTDASRREGDYEQQIRSNSCQISGPENEENNNYI